MSTTQVPASHMRPSGWDDDQLWEVVRKNTQPRAARTSAQAVRRKLKATGVEMPLELDIDLMVGVADSHGGGEDAANYVVLRWLQLRAFLGGDAMPKLWQA